MIQPGAAAFSLTQLSEAESRKASVCLQVSALAHVFVRASNTTPSGDGSSLLQKAATRTSRTLSQGVLDAMRCLLNSYGCFDAEDKTDKRLSNEEGSTGIGREPELNENDRQNTLAKQYKQPRVKDQTVSDFVTVVQCRHIMEMLFNQLCIGDERKQQQKQTKSSEKDTLKDNLSWLLVEQVVPKCLARPLHRLIDAGNLAVHGGAWKSTYSHAYQSLNAVLSALHVLNFETNGSVDEHGKWIPSDASKDDLCITVVDDVAMPVHMEKAAAVNASTIWEKLSLIVRAMLPTFMFDFMRWLWGVLFGSKLARDTLERLKKSSNGINSRSSTSASNMAPVTRRGNKCSVQPSGKMARVEDLHFMIHVLEDILPSMPALAKHAVDLMIRSCSMSADIQCFIVAIQCRQVLEVALSHRYYKGATIERLRKLVNRLCEDSESGIPKSLKGPMNRVVDFGNKAVHGEVPLTLAQAMSTLGSLLASLRVLRFFNDGLWKRHREKLMEQSNACCLVESIQTTAK